MTQYCHATATLIYENKTPGKWQYVECQTSCITLITTLFMKHIELKSSNSHSRFVTASIQSKFAL